MAGMNKNELVKLIKDELAETQEALNFVLSELAKRTNTQFNRVYQRKKSEYEGAIDAYKTILEAAEGVSAVDSTNSS